MSTIATNEEIIDSFLKSEYYPFFKVISHNEKLFLLDEDFAKADYLNLKEKVIELYLLFSVIDGVIKKPILDKLMKDIINLVFFFDELEIDMDNVWKKFEKSTQCQNIGYDEFRKIHIRLIREYKIKVSKVTTIRIFLFDSLLWKEANSSRNIVRYIRNLGITWVDTTKEFLEKSTFNDLPCIDLRKFFLNEKNLFPIYTADEIELIFSIVNGTFFRFEENELLDRVIKAKKGFKFFRNIDDEDLRHVIKDLKFVIYKRHEIVIKEGDSGDEIYILIDGECRVTAGKNAVGTISQGHIFGEFSPVTGEKRSATIRVNSLQAKVLSFKIAFEKFTDEPKIFANLYRNIVESLIVKLDTANKRL